MTEFKIKHNCKICTEESKKYADKCQCEEKKE